ncbi:MAG: BtpA/SgcQ family protein [Euryarchaeota archaeon]|nr:BtpA/SgcQ family protein [Euryarchaeota archaeon]
MGGRSARRSVSRDHALLQKDRPLVGVVHLPPLSGPRSPGVEAILERARADAEAYATAGFDALLVENFGDTPFPKERSEPHVAAMVGRAVATAREASGLPTGANVLRNDVRSALAAAHAGGGVFVRVNVLTGVLVTDQGLIEGDAHDVLTYRDRLGRGGGPERILVCADVAVKHAAPLAPRRVEDEAHDTAHRARADVLLVTGSATGRAPIMDDLFAAKRGAGGVPVWAASGVDEKTVAKVLEVADGVVVGSAVKQGGVTHHEVDADKAHRFVQAAGR